LKLRWAGYPAQKPARDFAAGICQVGLYPDHIRLAFIHGVFLPDPAGLLTVPAKAAGMRNRLAKRWIDLHAYDEVPWDAVRALIAAHAQFDPRRI
jgi:hypothetical protein